MAAVNLLRWGGVAAVLAGALYALAAVLHPVGEDLAAVQNPNWVPAHLTYWVSSVLMLLGLVGSHVRQASKSGMLGLVGFVLAFVGTALVGAIVFMVATVIPSIAARAPELLEEAMAPPTFALLVFVVAFGVGYSLFGVATMRAGVFPRWSGLMLILGTALFVIAEASPFDPALSHVFVTIGDVVFGLGLAWMGYTLSAERRNVAVVKAAA